MGRPPGSRNKTETGTEVTTIDQPRIKSVIGDMADRFGMEPLAFEAALRATVVPKDCAPAQFAAFLMVAKEYNLNPLTKEIYAFPSRGGGIVPIVSVDGWVNLINAQGQCDGFSFEMEHDGDKLISCTCSMYRKDRKHPVVVTEYYSECVRQTDPWKMKHRMLRHKSLIQAGRYAFGFSGIYDEDEGQKIAEIDPNRDAAPPRTATAEPKQIEHEPPRSAAPEPGPGQDHAAGDVQDGEPPRRAPKAGAKPATIDEAIERRMDEARKTDPITSGPQRTTTKPAEQTVAPFKIPGEGHTYESWSTKYVDNLKTSPDMAIAYKWIDLNSDPLARLSKGKPSVYAGVKKETEQLQQTFRDAAEKAKDKAAKAAKAKPAEPPPADMADESSSDMDDGTGETPPDYGKPSDDNPETVLKWIDGVLATAEDPADIEVLWERECQRYTVDMIPPDRDEAAALVRKHEKRLEP